MSKIMCRMFPDEILLRSGDLEITYRGAVKEMRKTFRFDVVLGEEKYCAYVALKKMTSDELREKFQLSDSDVDFLLGNHIRYPKYNGYVRHFINRIWRFSMNRLYKHGYITGRGYIVFDIPIVAPPLEITPQVIDPYTAHIIRQMLYKHAEKLLLQIYRCNEDTKIFDYSLGVLDYYKKLLKIFATEKTEVILQNPLIEVRWEKGSFLAEIEIENLVIPIPKSIISVVENFKVNERRITHLRVGQGQKEIIICKDPDEINVWYIAGQYTEHYIESTLKILPTKFFNKHFYCFLRSRVGDLIFNSWDKETAMEPAIQVPAYLKELTIKNGRIFVDSAGNYYVQGEDEASEIIIKHMGRELVLDTKPYKIYKITKIPYVMEYLF